MYLSTHPLCGFGWIDGHVTRGKQGLWLFQRLREVEKRDPGNEVAGGQASKCPRTELKVMLKFSRNGELLCGAWLLKSFEQREGQRILSYSRNRVEIEAQKSKL